MGTWLQPFGPKWFDIYWMPFLAAAIGFSSIVALFLPRRPPHGRHETLQKLEEMAKEKEMEKATYITLSMLFWMIIACLVAAVVLRYI
ncbi:MAG: hypothetical protein R6X10_10895 [Desulfobacterales bacterium]